jgi:hypothetical protein
MSLSTTLSNPPSERRHAPRAGACIRIPASPPNEKTLLQVI